MCVFGNLRKLLTIPPHASVHVDGRPPGSPLLPTFETVMRRMMDWKKTLASTHPLKNRLLQFKILVRVVCVWVDGSRACVRAYVRAYVRACVCACMPACYVCVRKDVRNRCGWCTGSPWWARHDDGVVVLALRLLIQTG